MQRHTGALLIGLLISLWVRTAVAANSDFAVRSQASQHGDFVLIGNALGHDCRAQVPAPVLGTIGACVTDASFNSSLSDSAPDVFWRSDDPQDGAALADVTLDSTQARSTAILQLPADALVTYARLYWSAKADTGGDMTRATLDRPGVAPVELIADTTTAAASAFYQSSVEVTSWVQLWGPGPYRLGAIDALSFVDVDNDIQYAAWTLVVFYTRPSDPLRQLTLFDGFIRLTSPGTLDETISGILVPAATRCFSMIWSIHSPTERGPTPTSLTPRTPTKTAQSLTRETSLS